MLYALRDHEVMESLLPGVAGRTLDIDQARRRLRDNPGLVPIAVRPRGAPGEPALIYFADIGNTAFLEWKHIYTIRRLAETNAIGESFATDFGLLDEPLAVDDGMQPDGLLLHVSRCGSTLFCKSLSRLESNLIINQAGPLQYGFWAALTDSWSKPLAISEVNLARARRLVHLLTRRRGLDYRRCFIKFISWNTVYADFIRLAFPDSRMLFLYREPAEVIAMVLQETTAALTHRGTPLAEVISGRSTEESKSMDDIEYLAHCYANYYRVIAERAAALNIGLINYEHIRRPECFGEILDRGLRWQPGAPGLRQMLEQYRYDAKDDSNQTPYQGELDPDHMLGRDGRRRIDAIAATATRALDESERNLFNSVAVESADSMG